MRKNNRRRPAPRKRAATAGGSKGESNAPVTVVGVGAPAGSQKSLQKLFSKMPTGRGVAFVLIRHIQHAHRGLLVKMLKKQTTLSVVEAKNGMPVLADRIHVIPPDKFLNIVAGRLTLQEPVLCNGLRMPIDHFFCSLAVDQRHHGIGVILSGKGSDGTLGLSEIKAAGGRTIVEDPAGVKHPDMSKSAIDAGVAEEVLPVEGMAPVLMNLAEKITAATRELALPSDISPVMRAILEVVRTKIGHDFRCYKPSTLVRRINRRIGLAKVKTPEDYAKFLHEHPEEVGLLQKDLLIGVTDFFRQPHAWETLNEKVISGLVENAQSGAEIRVWIPGCSTGKEAYSLAMLLVEEVEKSGKNLSVQIFATDSDVTALATARSGVYSKEDMGENVSLSRLKKFFLRKDGHYQVVKDIRERIVFAPQNITADPPFSRLDLISCRNLLIYLEQEVQRKIIDLFHFSLREGGFLFLGTAETVGDREDLFEPVSKKWRIYRRIGVGHRVGIEIPVRVSTERDQAAVKPPITIQPSRMSLTSGAQHMLLDRFVPACVMIDRKLQVLYVHGRVEDYMTFPAGELTTRIVDMAREGLRARLRGAIAKCLESNKSVVVTARVRRGEKSVPVKAVVSPLRYPREIDGLLLITFEDYRVPVVKSGRRIAEASDTQQLMDELKITREELQSTIEQLENSNDELKASNEEVMAANEELQSANEELETSKEELQSLNEELNTINARLHDKVDELENINNDVVNLLSSTNIATLFLDKNFKIKRFTPAVTNLFSLIPSDTGRHIADVLRRFTDDALLDDARLVLANLTPLSAEVQNSDGRWYIRSIMPYRTQDDYIEGVVVTFVDVDDLKRAEDTLRETRRRLAVIVDSIADGFYVLDREWRFTHVNDDTLRHMKKTREEVIGRSLFEIHPAARGSIIEAEYRNAMEKGEPVHIETTSLVSGGMLDIHAYPAPDGLTVLFRDVTERKRAEQEIRLQNSVQKAINRVFQEVIASQTEEELGERCLAIAEALTGSKIGFIGEIGADGYLHDVAISNPGWDACAMHDKTGHRRPPGDFKIHGIYGRVLKDRKGLIVNEPSAHPDSIGLPEGHPPLTSFLGVPFIQNGKIFGMIALGNRESGYAAEQQRALELLTPVVFQTLLRKRAEAALHEAHARSEWLARLPEENPNPVMRVAADGTVLYCNPAAMNTPGCECTVGRPLPSLLRPFLERAMTSSEEVEQDIEMAGRIYSVTVVPIPEAGYANIYGRDVTARKQAEDAVRERERLFQDVIDGSTSPVFLKDRDGRFITINAALEKMLGMSREELKGKTDYDIAPKEVADYWQEHDNMVMATGKAIQMEEVADLPDGHHVFLANKFPLVDAHGQIYGVGAISHDITARKQAEEALKESEERYRRLFENLNSAFILIEPILDGNGRLLDFKYLMANPAVSKHLKKTPEEMVGRLFSEVFKAGRNSVFDIYEQVLATGEPYKGELLLPAPNRHYDIAVYRPSPGRLALVFSDVTERKRAEDALRESEELLRRQSELLEYAPVLVRNLNDEIILWNSGMENLYGYSPDEAMGKVSHDLLKTSQPLPTAEMIIRHEGRWEGELHHKRKDGGDIVVKSLQILHRDIDGDASAVIEVNADITARKQAEEELQTMLQRLNALVANMHSGILFVGAGKVELANQAFCDFFDLPESPAEINGITAHEMIEKIKSLYIDPEKEVAHIWEIARRGKPVFGEEITMRNGRTYLRDFIPIYSDGRSYGLLWHHLDITERKQAEERASRGQKTFSELVERAPFGIYIVDSQFRIAQMNIGSQNGAFRNVRPVIGRPFDEAMRILWPEPVAAEIIAHFRHTLETGETYYSPSFINPRADAVIVESYEWELHRMILPDGQHGVICYYFDSTALRQAEAELASDIAALTRMHALSGKLLDTGGTQPLLQEVMDTAVAIMGAERGTLQLLEGNTLRIVAHHGHEAPFLEFFASAENRASVCGAALTSGDRVIVPDVMQSPLFAGTPSLPVLSDAGVRAVQSTPMVSRAGKLLGILTTQWSNPYSPGEHDLWRLDLLVRQGADLIEYTKAEEDLRQSEEGFRLLSVTAGRLLSTENPQAIVEGLCQEVMRYLDCQAFFNFLVDEKAGRMHLNACAGIPEEDARAIEWLNYGVAVCGCVAQTGERIIAEDILHTPDIRTELVKSYGIQAYCCHPLISEGKLIGTLSFGTKTRAYFTPEEVEMMRSVTDQVAVAMARKRAEDDLKRLNEELEERVGARTAELRAASLYSRSLIEASLDPLVTISLEGKITDVNEATEKVTGWSRQKLIGTDFSDYFTEPDAAQAGYRKVLTEGQVRDYPLTIRHASGSTTDVLYHATVYRHAQGEVQGVFAAARDVTERKRIEAELVRYRDHLEDLVKERTAELEAANKELESFSYSVSHDLRAPLRAIDGYARLIMNTEGDKFDAETTRKFNAIRSNAQMMGQLIADILTLSRVVKKQLSASKLEMAAIVRDVWKEIETINPERNMKFTVGSLPAGYGDSTLIRQVYSNLLANSAKFTKYRDPALIEVGGYVEGDENVYYIKDNGAGFEMEYYDKLFGIFQRLHKADEFEGTGVGLATVQRIVQRHGGRAWAEGKPNEGATFYFSLPVKRSHQ